MCFSLCIIFAVFCSKLYFVHYYDTFNTGELRSYFMGEMGALNPLEGP